MTGWVGGLVVLEENGLSDDVHYCIHADVVGGGVGQKKSEDIQVFYIGR